MAHQNASRRGSRRPPPAPAATKGANTELVQTRVSPTIKALLNEAVESEGITEAGYVRRLLIRHFGEHTTFDKEPS